MAETDLVDPPEPAEAPDAAELKLGHTPRGTAANAVLLALTRAARSFLLYDPRNEAIRHFLDVLRDTVEGYSEEHGDLPLTVRPFELVVDGEVVYLDRDRERSLAFRLYRDGVRKIALRADVTWAEVLKLLEVLSIRFVGVRQTEDDMVVLLWKAGFQHIDIEAVEGFVPDEEVGADQLTGDDGGGSAAPRGKHVDAPADFDLPAPVLRTRQPVVYQELPELWREGLVAEDSVAHLPDLCQRLVDALLRLVTDPTEPATFSEVVPQLRELRDFVLTDAHLAVVLKVARSLAALELDDAAAQERDQLLASFADRRALARIVHGVPLGVVDAPFELVELIDLVPGDHVEALVDVLGAEGSDSGRRVVRSLLERYVTAQGDAIVQRIPSVSGPVACELLRTLRYVNVVRAVEAVRLSAGRSDEEFERAALRVLEVADLTANVGALFGTYVNSANPTVRQLALRMVATRHVHGAFPAVLERLKQHRILPADADAYGAALAGADPSRAHALFREWIRPKGFFAALGPPMLTWVAVSGLSLLAMPDVEELIQHASKNGGTDLQRHCTACMVRHRRILRGAKA